MGEGGESGLGAGVYYSETEVRRWRGGFAEGGAGFVDVIGEAEGWGCFRRRGWGRCRDIESVVRV